MIAEVAELKMISLKAEHAGPASLQLLNNRTHLSTVIFYAFEAEVTQVNQIHFQGSSLSYNSSRLIQYILKSIIQNQKVETYVELL